jgi:hypothetical protein
VNEPEQQQKRSTDLAQTQKDKSDSKDSFGEAFELVKAYARQETVEPLKNLGRFLKYGIAGGICLTLGIIFLAMSLLRYLQSHRFFGQHITGNWSWLPYAIVFAVGVVVAALFAWRITKEDRRG